MNQLQAAAVRSLVRAGGASSYRTVLRPLPPQMMPRNFSDIVSGKDAAKLTIDGIMADDEDEEEMVEMFIEGPGGVEWGGPTRGGKHPEPTRYGDWEQKGRVSDF